MRPTPLLFLPLLLALGGCALFGPGEPEPDIRHRPAGVIRRVNIAEKYLIFESSYPFSSGQNVHAVRNGRRIATLRVHPFRQRPFYAADILDGAPRPGDLVE